MAEINKIQKPITVIQTELADSIMSAIKESNLHPSLLMPVIDEIHSIVRNTLNVTKQEELQKYEDMLLSEQQKSI